MHKKTGGSRKFSRSCDKRKLRLTRQLLRAAILQNALQSTNRQRKLRERLVMTAQPNAPRKRLYVDKKVQGAMVRKLVIYWVACLYAIFCVLAGVPYVIGMLVFSKYDVLPVLGETWIKFWPVACAAMLILPFVLFDMIRNTNKFAGPILRIRGEISRLLNGEDIRPVRLRNGDHWHELAEDFNELAEELIRTRMELNQLRESAVALEDTRRCEIHQPSEAITT